jgi:MtN3 and saliva related transmembrane protein
MSAGAISNDMLGYLAGTLTTIAFVPQLVRIVRRRSAHDISWGMFCILSAGVALWLWYGILVTSLPLIAANAVTLLLVLAILVLKLRYGSRARSARRRGQTETEPEMETEEPR